MLGSLTLPSQSSLTFHRQISVRAAVSEVGHSTSSDAAAAVNRSLYEVLRVKRNASQTEIKTAYRTLAKLYHPDATSRFMESTIAESSEDQDFTQIHNAYATLSDPDARAVYDANFELQFTNGVEYFWCIWVSQIGSGEILPDSEVGNGSVLVIGDNIRR